MDTNDTQIEEGQDFLSPEGYKELGKRLEVFKSTRRLEIAERLEYAKSLGDLSENAEYSEAKEEQMINEAEIIKLEGLLARAKVVKHKKGDTVTIGSVVECQKKGDGIVTFTLVGREEANPSSGKISNKSPIGQAFLGSKKNETVLVSTPKGKVEYLIIDIA
ncbi:MAG: transcription elongation factor GreA [bacterium]|nr:transcription elongation factor GreA [bacterium]